MTPYQQRIARRVDGRSFRVRRFLPAVDAAGIDTPELEAYYYALRLESASCWPLVLKGEMEHDRFHERHLRMANLMLARAGLGFRFDAAAS